jgi:ferredoxin--NADP+ reductase
MTFVITHGCCNDASCISVCPVQCIRPRPGDPDFTTAEQLYIDPATCIDCGACQEECPVEAVHSEWDLPEEYADYLAVNAEYFTTRPIDVVGPPTFSRRLLPEGRDALRVAIVGAGPAACYAATALSDIKGVSVTMIERLPTPFGLIRFGVAPDHARTKKIGERFAAVLGRKQVECWFNVEVGRDVTIDELLQYHHAVLWAGGAADDRKLGIPGEELDGVRAARDFVAWYNGHPDHANDSFDLSGKRVVVVGNGNVALDVARTLVRPVVDFHKTDMAAHAVSALATSSVEEVVVVARRAPEHAAFTTGELQALDRIEGITVVTERDEVANRDGSPKIDALARAADREAVGPVIRLRFGLTPVAFQGESHVEGVVFERSDGTVETIEASLVLRAIGYRGRPSSGLPFDDVTATVPHEAGRVVEPADGEPIPGLYCSGWIKRGPRGVIGSNRLDAEETVDSILDDLREHRLAEPVHSAEQFELMLAGRVERLVDKRGWSRIDREEKRRGREVARPRLKFVTIDELLSASAEVAEPSA